MLTAHQLLLEHFQAPADADSADLVWEHGDPVQALLLFPVFFPEFTEIEGHVILKSYVEEESGPERLQNLLRAGDRPVAEILDGYRWRELPSQFAHLSNATDATFLALANFVARSWEAALQAQYPTQRWSTQVLSSQETGGEIAVSFSPAA